MKNILLFIMTIAMSSTMFAQQNEQAILIDSIDSFINQAKQQTLKNHHRLEHLKKAKIWNQQITNDSLRGKNFLNIAFGSYTLKDSLFFIKTNSEGLQIANSLNDTLTMADAHWNFGIYYYHRDIFDTSFVHYQKAYQYFKKVEDDLLTARMLYNMALIQKNVKDYTGSEVLIFQSLPIFKKLNEHEKIYLDYNLLGVVYKELQEYDKAIEYHRKAASTLEKVKDNENYIGFNFNNLGLLHQKQGNYKKAIEFFNKALTTSNLKRNDFNQYIRIKDNLAYTRLLMGDSTNVLTDLKAVLHLRDSVSNESGVVVSKLHLSEYYAKYKDTAQAIRFAYEAKTLAQQINNHRDELLALQLLATLDPPNSNTYLQEYIQLNNQLQTQERQTRNKFTRIRFETDEYIEKTAILSQQKTIILFSSIITLIIFGLLLFIRIQRSKNLKLIFEKDQQKASEEIYSLLLRQQSIKEESSLEERHRISEELHDGIIGKIFGTRMTLGFLDLNGTEENMAEFEHLVIELQDIEKEIRNLSHELKNDPHHTNQNFGNVVASLIDKHSLISNFQYSIDASSNLNWNLLDGLIKMNIYRIIQEVLLNCHKHAKASFMQFNFLCSDATFKLIIEDNGVGFDPKKQKKGIGLKNIESRVFNINGKFQIESVLNLGTTVSVTLPFKLKKD